MPNNEEKELELCQRNYIETLATIKSSLILISNSQKEVNDKLYKFIDDYSKHLLTLTMELKAIKENLKSLELRLMMSNGKNGSAKNGNYKDKNEKTIKEQLDKEEEIEKELVYRFLGRAVITNWKFLLLLVLLAIFGFFFLFGEKSLSNFLIKLIAQ